MKFTKPLLATVLAALTQLPVAAQARPAPDPAGHALAMTNDGIALRVSGGNPYDPCAIMLGFQETAFVLPGNALLSVVPLVILPPGEFNVDGEYELDLSPLREARIRPLAVFAQAISVVSDSGDFATSNVLMLDAESKKRFVQRDVDPVPVEPRDVDPVPVEPEQPTHTAAARGAGR